jgi:DNA-binding response OmpR family regulator
MNSRFSTAFAPGAPAAMPNDSKPIVLVADDEPSMVAMLSSHLRSKGYTVLEASDGDQAWELAHEHLPNLVLLDVMMPGMSGWEVCRKIREAVSLAHTGVIMLTGIGENLNEMTSPLYGADAYLDKPFEFSDLDQKISETIARREDGALGRADGDEDAGLVRQTLQAVTKRKAAKPKPVAEKEAELPAAKPAPKPKKAPAEKPQAKPEVAKDGPKPALAKAVARPAPKLEKPVAKTKLKAKPPVKGPAPKPVKPATKAAKPTKPVAKAAKKSAKPAPKTKPTKKAAPAAKAAKPNTKAAKKATKTTKKATKPAPKAPAKSSKKAPKPATKGAKKPAKAAPKSAKKTGKKR